MDQKRQGEIALLFVKNKLKKEGIRLTPNFQREIGNEAKEIGISFEEAREFLEIIVREQFERMFADAKKKKSD